MIHCQQRVETKSNTERKLETEVNERNPMSTERSARSAENELEKMLKKKSGAEEGARTEWSGPRTAPSLTISFRQASRVRKVMKYRR